MWPGMKDRSRRDGISLLHEIGHYLETDFELMKRICSFESDYAGKRFEEECKPVRVMALLPDKFISKWLVLDRSHVPGTFMLSSSTEGVLGLRGTRFRRIAVVRRLGALRPSLGYASLIKKPYERDKPPEVVCRAWNDGVWISLRNSQWRRTCCTHFAQSGKKRPKEWGWFRFGHRDVPRLPTAERPLRGGRGLFPRQQEFASVVEYSPEAGSRPYVQQNHSTNWLPRWNLHPFAKQMPAMCWTWNRT